VLRAAMELSSSCPRRETSASMTWSNAAAPIARWRRYSAALDSMRVRTSGSGPDTPGRLARHPSRPQSAHRTAPASAGDPRSSRRRSGLPRAHARTGTDRRRRTTGRGQRSPAGRDCVHQGSRPAQALRPGGEPTLRSHGVGPELASRLCGTPLAPVPAVARSSRYEPRSPAQGVLYQVVREYYETFRAQAERMGDGGGLPRFVQAEFEDFLRCGRHRNGCGRAGQDDQRDPARGEPPRRATAG
jgi:hypothetical protein